MTKSEQYVADCIRLWVASGFYSAMDIDLMIDDILEEDCDADMLRALVMPAIRGKLDAQKSWPKLTDCDRLDKVFLDLRDAGVCALSNAGYTMSDGYSDVTEAVANAPAGHYHGYCFYHGQDVDRAVEGHGVMIAFGDLKDDPERSLAVGQQVAAALQVAGFALEWNRTIDSRIDIPVFEWQRRHPK